MRDKKAEEKLRAYHERHIRWTNTSITHLSFFNNLLITLSIGFLAFAFKAENFNNLSISICHINWSATCSVASILLLAISALAGIYFALNRAFDFILSRHLAITRYRMYKFYKVHLDDKIYTIKDSFSPGEKWLLTFKLLWNNPYKISVDKYLGDEDKQKVKADFIQLRKQTYNLGLITGRLLRCQVITFMLSIVCYILNILL